jgi:translation initiation factor IF-2
MEKDGNQVIELPSSITVRELAERIDTSPIEVIKILMSNGVMANINQMIDFETAAIVASEMGVEAILETLEDSADKPEGEIPYWRQIIDDEESKNLVPRPPVVTILGHVDHGKTTLLDAIRQTDVAGGEAGGITQHIGAYQIEHNGNLISFLDTPGHAAFTAMRARGAQGADIVVLVVASDDGVMPQTREAIAHCRAAQVPIIVALNKIDRPDANQEFVKKQLSDNGLVPDEWEGDTLVVPVSAKEKDGINDVLEAILLVADNINIKANPNGKVIGTIIEAKLEKGKGVVATLLVQNGTFKLGDVVAAGSTCGRIKAMFDYKGRKVKSAGPSFPVQVMGLSDMPSAGELFQTYSNEKNARTATDKNKQEIRDKLHSPNKMTLEELFEKFQAGEEKELRLVVKADVQGSLEPIITSLHDLDTSAISVNILDSGTGNISESDVMLASASDAIVVGFNVTADTVARRLADTEGVSIRLYKVIYRLIEDIEKALKGMLDPEYREVTIGKAVVRAVFRIKKVGNIAGCKVIDGEIHRNAQARVMREGKAVHESDLHSLKREKDDAKEVRQGFECGIGVKGFNDFEEGDIIECYTLERV